MSAKAIIHRLRWKVIKSFVNVGTEFAGINLRNVQKAPPHVKRKIKKYYDIISAQTDMPFHKYKSSSKNIKIANKETGRTNLKGMKYALIPTSGEKVRIRIKKGKMTVAASNGLMRYSFIEFDPKGLIKNAAKEVISKVKNKKNTFFTIANGHYEMFREVHSDVSALVESVQGLMTQYNNPEANNYAPNWLRGAYEYKVKKQKDITDYQRRKSDAHKQARKKRKARRRRLRNRSF